MDPTCMSLSLLWVYEVYLDCLKLSKSSFGNDIKYIWNMFVYESEVVHSLQCLFSGYIDVLLRVKGIQKVAMLWKWYKIVEDSKVESAILPIW